MGNQQSDQGSYKKVSSNLKQTKDKDSIPSSMDQEMDRQEQDQELEVNWEHQLMNILKSAMICDQDEVQEAFILFQGGEIQQLKDIPAKKYRIKFGHQIDQLFTKVKKMQIRDKKKQEKVIEQSMRLILASAEIQTEQEIKKCINLFKRNRLDQLKSVPRQAFQNSFAVAIDQLHSQTMIKSSNKQRQQQNFDEQSQFKAILKRVRIIQEKDIKHCFQLMREGSIYELGVMPAKKYRESFQSSLQIFLELRQRHNEEELRNQIEMILWQMEVNSQENISTAVIFFKNNDVQAILNMVDPSRRAKLEGLLKYSKEKFKIEEKKVKTIQQMFKQCKIFPQLYSRHISDLQKGDFQFLLKMTEKKRKRLLLFIDRARTYKMGKCSMEVHLRIVLSRYLKDEQIEQLLGQLKEGKNYKEFVGEKLAQIIEQIEREHQLLIHLRIEGKSLKDIAANQIVINYKQFWIEKMIESAAQIEKGSFVVFVGQKQIDVKDINFQIGHQYVFQIYRKRSYRCRYNSKYRRIALINGKSINYNKSLIWAQLLQKKDVIYNEQQPFDFERMKLKLYNQQKQLFDGDLSAIQGVEDQSGEIPIIEIEINLKIVLYYQNLRYFYSFSNRNKVIDFKKQIHSKQLAFDSQILRIKKQQKYINVEGFEEQQLTQITPNFCIFFELTSAGDFQFYGFNENRSLSFEEFSQFFIENQEITGKLIQNCSFSRQFKEEETQFIQHFFYYVYSGIKKRFPIKLIIDKFKILVSKIKRISIWNPNSDKQGIKVNQAFVFCFMLKNADSRLRIELMNLLKQNMTIPLYLKPFESIQKIGLQEEFQINQELLWILKEGFTIASYGLHTENAEKQKGKSSLLNQIFPTYFQQRQNKHCIIKGLPYIALNIFQNILPMHIIDIPHDFPSQVAQNILNNVDMIIVHSWRGQVQTQQKLNQFRQTLKKPIICLLRDDKDKCNSLKKLGQNNIAGQKPQRIINLSNRQSSKIEINIVKSQIFAFVHQKFSFAHDLCGLFGLYQKNKIYQQFSLLVGRLKKNMLELCPMAKQLQRLRIKSVSQKGNCQQEAVIAQICPQIRDIVTFLKASEVNSYQNLLLNLLRDKLKSYQSQLNLRYIRIYELRDKFAVIQEMNPEQKNKKIDELNEQLNSLKELRPVSIVGKSDKKIKAIIQDMAEVYENQVKPRIFSVELFWRELNYLIAVDQQIKIGDYHLLSTIKELKQTEINSNLPFQIIDGDMLQMPIKLMTKLFENKQDRAVVITILGPQSSGKSTLLNFLFGCDFATSEGRCTRGVYGTYFRFAQNRGTFFDIANCQGIFVLDTEGLFGITNQKDNNDQDRNNFDSKLVLFCLAVSDYVIINVRGNLDQNTEKVVRISHERLQDLSVEQINKPQVIVILNQNTSDSKQQSQNEFSQIRKSIDFDLSKSLSLAYQIKNFGHRQIGLFQKSQKLTKKYPLETFLRETTNLRNQIIKKIMKRKRISKLNQAIDKFQRIWSIVISFPNLSKAVSNQYRVLQRRIKKWKEVSEESQTSWRDQKLQEFKRRKITQSQLIKNLQLKQKQLLLQFDQQFSQKASDDQQIKVLIRKERSKMISKDLAVSASTKYQIDCIKLQMQLKLSQIEGDFMFKEKAKQIFSSNISLSEEDKKKIFDQYFNEQLQKIRMKISIDEEVIQEYQKIYDSYEFLIREQSCSERGLPKEKGWIGDSKCDVKTMIKFLKNKLIEPNSSCYQDVFIHSSRGKRRFLQETFDDSSLEYFNVKDYFKIETQKDYFSVSKSQIEKCFKKQVFQENYRQIIEEANKKFDLTQRLKEIWKQINYSLQTVGLKFTNFDHFKELFLIFEGGKLAKFKSILNMFKNKKEEIYYEFVKDEIRNQSSVVMLECDKNSYQCRNDTIYGKQEKNNHEKHQFTRFLHSLAGPPSDKRCLCEYTNLEPSSYLLPRFYEHIHWNEILQEIQKEEHYQLKLQMINQNLNKMVNEELSVFNLRIMNWIDWKYYFDQAVNADLRFQVIQQPIILDSQEKLIFLIEQSMLISPHMFKQALSRHKDKDVENGKLSLFVVDYIKFEQVEKNSFLLKDKTSFFASDFHKNEMKAFFFKELRQGKRKSFQNFFFKIFQIVENVMTSWKKVDRKVLMEIYSEVNKQIYKFNNAINQVYLSLSDRYLGYIHATVIYMIWKLTVEQKSKEKMQIYEDKQKQYENEWRLFKARTSKDEDTNVQGDIDEFLEQLLNRLSQVISNRKKELMIVTQRQFGTEYCREKVQMLVDIDIFRKETRQEIILEYLQSPSKFIVKKYEQCYEKSWFDVLVKYSTQRTAKQVVKDFQEIVSAFYELLEQCGIDQSKKYFSDIFEIVDKDIQVEKLSASQDDYHEQGKRVLYQYFIDTLLSQNCKAVRKCAKVDVLPIIPINIVVKVSILLRQILLDLKKIKNLRITNLSKFVERLLAPETRERINLEIDKMNKMTEKDKIKYINTIKVIVCNQNCPCCGRICDVENEHKEHKCLYGHQMRGLNGTYFERENKIREASVIRCEQLNDTDALQYAGQRYTWAEFKEFQKSKKLGGWLFDEAYKHSNPHKQRFEDAWTIAGPIYCKKYGLNYVNYNKSADQQKERDLGSVHYIFALDSSNSNPDRWNDLLVSFKQAIDKLKKMDGGANNIKVSAIKFAATASIIHENCSPHAIYTGLYCVGGGMNLDDPLIMAANIAQKYISQATVILVLMASNQGKYPTVGVQNIKLIQRNSINKINYVGINFGYNIQVMKVIANEIKGITSTTYTSDLLTAHFQKNMEIMKVKQ